MVGIPKECQTKDDWRNAVSYAKENSVGKTEMKARLEHLRDDHFVNVLKEASKGKDAEELTPDDFENAEDPAAEKTRLGFTDEEIEELMEELV